METRKGRLPALSILGCVTHGLVDMAGATGRGLGVFWNRSLHRLRARFGQCREHAGFEGDQGKQDGQRTRAPSRFIGREKSVKSTPVSKKHGLQSLSQRDKVQRVCIFISTIQYILASSALSGRTSCVLVVGT